MFLRVKHFQDKADKSSNYSLGSQITDHRSQIRDPHSARHAPKDEHLSTMNNKVFGVEFQLREIRPQVVVAIHGEIPTREQSNPHSAGAGRARGSQKNGSPSNGLVRTACTAQ